MSGVEWQNKYYELLNCVKSTVLVVDNVEFTDDVNVTSVEIYDVILKLFYCMT